DRTALYETANLHDVRQSGLPGARKLRVRSGRGILFWQTGWRSQGSGSRAHRRNGEWSEVLSVEQPDRCAGATQSGADPDGRGGENPAPGGRSREEDAARSTRLVSAKRSCPLLF